MSAGSMRERSPGKWELKYDVPRGADGQRQTRTETFKGTKSQARQRLRALLTAVDKGEHVDRSKVTVAEHVAERIKTWPGSARTREHYNELLALIAAHLGAVPIQKLTTLQVEQWHATLRDKGLGGNTVRHAHNLLSRALGDGVKHGLLVRNVAALQKPPTVARKEVQSLKADQIEPLLAKLQGDPFYVPTIVAIYCGLRRGELLALKWGPQCVDLDAKVIKVREALEETKAHGIVVKPPKTTAGRRDVSLSDNVVAALHEHWFQQIDRCLALGLEGLPSDALVFPAMGGGHQSPRAFSMAWGRTVRRLGLPDVTWHALRHTHASQLIAAGVPITTVSARLGHASPNITLQVYAHLYEQDDSAAAAAINAAVAAN